MSDEKLIAALAELAREEQREGEPLDDPWVRLVEGKMRDDELGALESQGAEDEHVRLALDAYRPLGAKVREEMAARALATLAAAPRDSSASSTTNAERAAQADRGAHSKVVPFRKALGRALVVFAPLAAAAAVAFVVIGTRRDGNGALPNYALDVSGGDRLTRGAPAEPETGELRISEGSRFSIVLRPDARVVGPVAARVVLSREGRNDEEWRVPLEVAPEGAVRLVATTADLPDRAPGTWALVVAVGRPNALPRASELASGASGEGFRRFDVRLVVEASDPAE